MLEECCWPPSARPVPVVPPGRPWEASQRILRCAALPAEAAAAIWPRPARGRRAQRGASRCALAAGAHAWSRASYREAATTDAERLAAELLLILRQRPRGVAAIDEAPHLVRVGASAAAPAAPRAAPRLLAVRPLHLPIRGPLLAIEVELGLHHLPPRRPVAQHGVTSAAVLLLRVRPAAGQVQEVRLAVEQQQASWRGDSRLLGRLGSDEDDVRVRRPGSAASEQQTPNGRNPPRHCTERGMWALRGAPGAS
mmetsp:Transcript_109439/g.306076  ORF Transcript_109439/g.306076 Transcript_109439/m.306076 type:complete len:253 (+) Transcript_109439:34-792(+)